MAEYVMEYQSSFEAIHPRDYLSVLDYVQEQKPKEINLVSEHLHWALEQDKLLLGDRERGTIEREKYLLARLLARFCNELSFPSEHLKEIAEMADQLTRRVI